MKELHIVAKGTGWEDAPVNGEIWGVNDVCAMRDVSLCFYMDREAFIKTKKSSEEDIKELTRRYHVSYGAFKIMDDCIKEACNEKNTPLFCTKKFDDIPTSKSYPIEEIKMYFGVDYFGNSLDYMMAYALYNGYRSIHTWGLNMNIGTKYIHEKPAMSFWLGYALGLGAEIHLHGAECEMLRTHDGLVYAYHERQIMSRENVKCLLGGKPKKLDFSSAVMLLDPTDRLLFINVLLNGDADFETVEQVVEFQKAISFTEEEQKKLKFYAEPGDKRKKAGIRFVEDIVPPKEFKVPSKVRMLAMKTLVELDKSRQITKPYRKLYKELVLGE